MFIGVQAEKIRGLNVYFKNWALKTRSEAATDL